MMQQPESARHSSGPTFALAAAVLFGVSTPFAKLIGEDLNAFLLAGLLYLGSGLGLAAWRYGSRRAAKAPSEAALQRADVSWMAAVVLFGGVLGPALLMFGLQSASGSAASLLLNLESLATMLIAWLVYRESVDRRLFLGAMAILAGAVLLSWDFASISLSGGAVLVAGACVCWGIDNNLTRKISGSDPVQIAMIKGLAAGATNTILGLVIGAAWPTVPQVAAAGALGFVGYGVSLVFFVLALRHLGAARTGAYFSTAPFVGAVIAIALFQEPLSIVLGVAALLMALGVWLHLTEDHDHTHEHEELTHNHAHTHDEHHQHAHASSDPAGEPHTHTHTHPPMRHKHRHYPDLHHRHGH
jgi:drug/metabolite transporter (DMT)-like permease